MLRRSVGQILEVDYFDLFYVIGPSYSLSGYLLPGTVPYSLPHSLPRVVFGEERKQDPFTKNVVGSFGNRVPLVLSPIFRVSCSFVSHFNVH